MGNRSIDKNAIDMILELKQKKMKSKDIADIFNMRTEDIDKFTKGIIVPSPSPLYNDAIKIDEDIITVTADWHIPYYSDFWANKSLEMSKKFKSKTLIIIGDFLNLETFSFFPTKEPHERFIDECVIAEHIMKILCKHFDKIYWNLGNHELRLHKKLAMETKMKSLLSLITSDAECRKKIQVSDYPYTIVNKTWRLTHPNSYSQTKAAVANRLCAKHRMSILNAHGHFISMVRDQSGNDTVCDSGGMFDRARTAYIAKTDTTHPVWNNGFFILKRAKDGVTYPYMFAEGITNWEFWKKIKIGK